VTLMTCRWPSAARRQLRPGSEQARSRGLAAFVLLRRGGEDAAWRTVGVRAAVVAFLPLDSHRADSKTAGHCCLGVQAAIAVQDAC
jgi:hypothetical protein